MPKFKFRSICLLFNIVLLKISMLWHETFPLQCFTEEIIKLAHQPTDFIKRCEFLGLENHPGCSNLTSGGTNIFSTDAGLCYMFNFRGVSKATEPGMKAYFPGPKYGLQLTLDIQGNILISKFCMSFNTGSELIVF